MSTYLLLRNNKESGPYSANDLKALGLKPYDLVWLNGKSAAWRYPSEMEELKSFAPALEEQPYDRFYKKTPGEENKVIENENRGSVQANKEKPDSNSIPEIKSNGEQTTVSLNGRKVYVSLPKTGKPVKNQEPELKPEKNAQDVTVDFGNYLPGNISDQAEKVPGLEKKYSQPLDEIKDMYVQTLLDRKKKIARKGFAKQNLKKASLIVAVLITGIVLGLAFQHKDKKEASPISQNRQVAVNNPDDNLNGNPNDAIVSQKEDQPLPKEQQPAGTDPEIKQKEIKNNTEKNKTDVYLKQQQKPVLKSEIGKDPEKKNIVAFNDDKTLEPVPDIAAKNDPVTGERKKVVRTGNDAEPVTISSKTASPKFLAKENLLKQLSLKTSDYKTGPFGGIRDLNLTLTNNSQSQIDEVEVEVKYIGIEKTVVKTQKMLFHDIPARGQVRSDVPRTNRGISVECIITRVTSKGSGIAQTDF